MFRINTNILAINGQRNLFQTSKDLTTRMERLSSGLRINHAADDAAGIMASEGMRSQLAGLRVANDNSSRAIALLQTADSGLEQIGVMLIRLKELAEQSADGTLNTSNRSGLSTEAAALILEIDRIAASTTYNGISLIASAGDSGARTNLTFYVGDGTPQTAGSDQVVSLALKGVVFTAAGVGTIGDTSFVFTVDDFLTQVDAQALVTSIDAAVTTLATIRTDVGAFQNRLERTQENLQAAIENTARAESNIRDADFALEASAMTRAQILAQTGASMLSQANILPQLALSLIQ
jgi:flagellin